jgi:hypothetical protein
VEQQFRVLALRARRALAHLAEGAGVAWSFRVARGSVTREIHAAATESDLVSLGHIGWSLRQRRVLGRTARALLTQRRRYTLLTARVADIRHPVLAIFNGGRAGHEALRLALRLSGKENAPLVVALAGKDLARLRQAAIAVIEEAKATVRIVEVDTLGGLARFACELAPGLIILPVETAQLDENQVQDLLEEVKCPILAVS